MSNWERFQTAYQAASPEMRHLVDSAIIPQCVEQSLTKRGLPSLLVPVIALITYQTIRVQSIDEIMTELNKLGITDALQFIAEMESCIKTKPQASLTAEIAEIETATESLENVRTMQKDMARVQQETPIYQSSQDSLLQARPAFVTPSETELPRWGTE